MPRQRGQLQTLWVKDREVLKQFREMQPPPLCHFCLAPTATRGCCANCAAPSARFRTTTRALAACWVCDEVKPCFDKSSKPDSASCCEECYMRILQGWPAATPLITQVALTIYGDPMYQECRGGCGAGLNETNGWGYCFTCYTTQFEHPLLRCDTCDNFDVQNHVWVEAPFGHLTKDEAGERTFSLLVNTDWRVGTANVWRPTSSSCDGCVQAQRKVDATQRRVARAALRLQ